VIDLDILIGEIPGNLFGAWLLIEKKGATYSSTTDAKGRRIPLLPVFQVKQKSVPVGSGDKVIPSSTSKNPWVCHP
jgi:hypothetical protein